MVISNSFNWNGYNNNYINFISIIRKNYCRLFIYLVMIITHLSNIFFNTFKIIYKNYYNNKSDERN